MKYLVRLFAPTLIFLLFLQVLPAIGQEKKEKEPWKGEFADGTVITEEDLVKILVKHLRWLKTNRKKGEQANLTNALLWGADLTNAELVKANLTNAKLAGANLTNAYLMEADLTNAYLVEADLTNAKLVEADLTNADLEEANLTNAKLAGANLTNAKLWGANLTNAKLEEANLTNAYLVGANLTNAKLVQADLTNAKLEEAVFSTKTNFFDANLKNAEFWKVKLPAMQFEPRAGSPPYIPAMATAENLKSLYYVRLSHGLVDLREGFKKAGFREQERAITYAIEHTKRKKLTRANPFSMLLSNKKKAFQNLPSEEQQQSSEQEPSFLKKLGSFIEKLGSEIIGWIYYTFVELTCSYGMTPWRPLLLLIFLSIPLFTIAYVFCLRKKSEDGIWKVWSDERRRKDLPKDEDESSKPLLIRGWPAVKVAFYFSILSAFSIGWRELNVGNWIARIQRYEFNYRATGWARTASGIQSLLSVYLLALWALTYFGRPFG